MPCRVSLPNRKPQPKPHRTLSRGLATLASAASRRGALSPRTPVRAAPVRPLLGVSRYNMAAAPPAEEMVAEGAIPGKDAAFGSGSTVLRPGRLRVMHPRVAELLRSPRRHARPAAASTKPAAPQQNPLLGCERARYACAFEDDDVGGGGGVAAPGRLVWGKVRDNPWWPGQVFDAADASADAQRALRRRRNDGVVLVAYFWDKTFAWNDAATTLLPFRDGFPRLAAMRPVADAVDTALAEVARRVTAGLSCCCCCGGGAGAGANRQVIDNAGVRDGAYGAPVDAAFARGALQAEALVGYVSALATKPRAGADRVDLTVAAAQIKALGRWRGSTRGLPEYTVVHGIDGGVSATAKRRRSSSSSTAGGGGDGSASAKRRVTRSSSRAAAKGNAGCDTGDYEALEQEDLPLPTPPQQMSTKIGKLMSRAAQQMSLSPVILRANGGGNSCPPPPPAVPAPDMARCAIAADEQFRPVSKNNGDHEAGLVLNFSSASAVPSPRHLTMIFSRFGPVKDVRADNSTALVIFNNGEHADKAFSGTAKIGSIRASLVSFRVTSLLPAAPVDDPPQPQSMPSDTSPGEALQ